MSNKLETYHGSYFDFNAPTPDQVDFNDIAHALSNTCRFGGHVSRFYSVAEHACLVRRLVIEALHPCWPERDLIAAALHHDSHEAYLGDIPTPLKRILLPLYDPLRRAADAAVATKLGIDQALFHDPIVVAADALALRIEARELKRSGGLGEYWGTYEETDHHAPWRLGMTPGSARSHFEMAAIAACAL